ncbi:unnamed protein product [Psylliodes chrysocephalus]|uniref:Centromere protein J C-terminal domain-containing protein n=1 Tax=Psylliodes chrysocephalus TaxID=3402493 RepID=A0A9P0D4P4_9CUCU|nr:unnamed protein product [Psylliodes chrysocephala]
MSLISSPYLVRLQELKLWQGNYDNLLQKKKCLNLTNTTDLDSLDEVTPLSDSNLNEKISLTNDNQIDWDNKAILPVKPFNELLEEKLAEDHPNKLSVKPKQPFLKKGSGLARFNVSPRVSSKTKKQALFMPEKSVSNELKISKQKEEAEQNQNKLTPLKVPEVTIKCKASWSKVNENAPSFPVFKNLENIEQFCELSNSRLDREVNDYTNFDHNQSERELHLFEMLEEKVAHSSFSSNNSSIMKLLSSTPNKKKGQQINDSSKQQNSEVLTKILQNLLISQKNQNICITDSSIKKSSPETTFSEDDGEKWSNCNSGAQSPSSFYTEFENTLERQDKTDAGVNTSFAEKSAGTQTQFDECFGCVQLRNKIEKLEKDLPNITAEKAKLCDFAKELESKRDQLYKELQYVKEKYEKDIEDLQEELETAKVKSAREKALIDMYLKESRPSKKDRDENETLKKELTDLKELMKLKETKNGTTQARLRNQIKLLEKEKTELKSSVEKLQKENAKLSASQKVHRNTESKMLQQINKNLNRLTEETKLMKNPEISQNSEIGKLKQQKKCRRKSMGDVKERIEKELDVQLNKTANIPSIEENKNSLTENEKEIEVIYSNNKHLLSDLEKRYESAFGLSTESENCMRSANESRKDTIVLSEKDFPDGSQEIKYANGSSKIISPDGKYIYIRYSNGDIKETNLIKNIKKYYFMSKDVWLTKFGDGVELVEFSNGQKEKKFPDGTIEVITSDGTRLNRFPGGTEEVNYPDGSKMVTTSDEKIIYLCNGQIETHNEKFKKREYPDGTIKIVYSDGTQESRYANGRVRLKDPDGKLILDSQQTET